MSCLKELAILNDLKYIKVSLIIPVYNIQNYIERCINSLLKQTFNNLELIFIDDGSKDNSGAILEDYKKRYSNIIVVHKNNEGVLKARIDGMKISNGDYVGFIDGDDMVEPNMIEILLKNSIKYDADISHCGYVMDFPDGRKDFYYNTGQILIQNNEQGLIDLVEGKFIEPGLWNKLYKKDVILKFLQNVNLDFNIKNTEDFLMNYYLFKYSSKSIFYDVCMYHYILRKNSAALKISRNKFKDPVEVLKILLSDNDQNSYMYKILYNRYMSLLISLSSQNYYIDIKKESKILLKKEYKSSKKKYLTTKYKYMSLGVLYFYPLYFFIKKIYNYITKMDKKYKV